MLKIPVSVETWDPNADNGKDSNGNELPKGRFGSISYGTLELEHSLISISKWEEIWHVSYFESLKKKPDQMLSYIKCMTINKNFKEDIYAHLKESDIIKIADYINDKHSATTFGDDDSQTENERNKQIITSELVYYWMFANQIPKECEKWHINRLLNLIRIFSIKNSEMDPNKKKMGVKDKNAWLAKRNALNAKRKAQLKTSG